MNTSTFKSTGVRWEAAALWVINRTLTHGLKVVVPTKVSTWSPLSAFSLVVDAWHWTSQTPGPPPLIEDVFRCKLLSVCTALEWVEIWSCFVNLFAQSSRGGRPEMVCPTGTCLCASALPTHLGSFTWHRACVGAPLATFLGGRSQSWISCLDLVRNPG